MHNEWRPVVKARTKWVMFVEVGFELVWWFAGKVESIWALGKAHHVCPC